MEHAILHDPQTPSIGRTDHSVGFLCPRTAAERAAGSINPKPRSRLPGDRPWTEFALLRLPGRARARFSGAWIYGSAHVLPQAAMASPSPCK